jgi:hypothetical protein
MFAGLQWSFMSGLFASSAIRYVTKTSGEYGRNLKIKSDRFTPPVPHFSWPKHLYRCSSS